MEKRKKETAEKIAFVNHQISMLEELVSDDGGLYEDYRNRIRGVLDQTSDGWKKGLRSDRRQNGPG